MNYFTRVQNEFTEISEEEQVKKLPDYGKLYMKNILEYSYKNLSGMKLLLSASAGTRYEDFLHQIVEIEIESTHNFMKALKNMGRPVHDFNSYFEHTIVSGMFTAYFELIIHDVPYEEAKKCSEEILKFYSAGWAACMEL